MSARAAAEALSFRGSVQRCSSAERRAAAGERCTTEASSSGSISQTLPTPSDTSTPAGESVGDARVITQHGCYRNQEYFGWGFNADLLHDEAGQDVHDEASQPGIHGEGLDYSAHEQHGERVLVHQLLHHHRQHLRRVHVLLAKAKVGSWGKEQDHINEKPNLYMSKV